MAKSEALNAEVDRISLQISSYPGDLLNGFVKEKGVINKINEESEETEEIELSLGLSLGGRFGVDPLLNQKLTRSSSISNFAQSPSSFQVEPTNLSRTVSLPPQSEEEWRKRKELQSMRRMEAKRKRTEKQRNVRVVRDRISAEDNYGDNGFIGGKQLQEQYLKTSAPTFAVTNWVAGAESGGACHGVLRQSSLGSIGSQGSGSGSSDISDFESQPVQGTKQCTKESSPSFVKAVERPSEKTTIMDKRSKEIERNVMQEMPCVSTTGEGPNGKRVEGFLYRYRKGEEVRIVCVCHGRFHSPAEFVKHAGGGDVVHPLKHIVVSAPPPFL